MRQDYTGNACPKKTLATGKEKTAPGFKEPKKRVTVMCCANASGTHKLKLVVIGKSEKPRAFKHIAVNDLPVVYYAQKSAWMDKGIFTKWVLDKWTPEVKSFLASKGLLPKAILVLDNAPSHPHESSLVTEDSMLVPVFLPPNVTPPNVAIYIS